MYVERFPSEEICECVFRLFYLVPRGTRLFVTTSMLKILVALCHSFYLADHFHILPYILLVYRVFRKIDIGTATILSNGTGVVKPV